MDMEEETRRELDSLQREKEVLQAKEKDNLDAIDEVWGHAQHQTEPVVSCCEVALTSAKNPPDGGDRLAKDFALTRNFEHNAETGAEADHGAGRSIPSCDRRGGEQNQEGEERG